MAQTVSFRYSKAFLLVALEQQAAAKLYEDLQLVKKVLERPTVFSALKSLRYKREKRLTCLEKTFSSVLHPLTMVCLRLVFRRRRESLLMAIIKHFLRQYERRFNIFEAHVTTAIALSNELREIILLKAKAMVHADKIKLTTHINPNILGGYILQVNDLRIDTSFHCKLEKLKQSFTT